MANENEGTAGDRDPVIAWLEEIRDFEGSTDRARGLARQALERLNPPAGASSPDQESPAPAARSTGDQKIQNIVDESARETERGRKARRKP